LRIFLCIGTIALTLMAVACGGGSVSQSKNPLQPVAAASGSGIPPATATEPPPATAAPAAPPVAPPATAPVPATPPPAPPSGGVQVSLPATATRFEKAEEMTGWDSCDVCAGINAAGPTAAHSIKQNIADPSLDGKAAQFSVGNNAPWAAALWWKQLGPNDGARHFVYDLQFNYDSPNAWALEFDVNQSTPSHWYIFGTECTVGSSQRWRVWDADHWVDTGVSCGKPAPNTWHHLTWEFERMDDDRIHFIAVTLNGQRSEINMYGRPKGSIGRGIDVAFQMDQNESGASYNAWLDQVSLSYW
jgi:hypothetical protein